jgi:hypothetical protein
VYTGLSAWLATAIMIAGPVLILVAEGPAIFRRLERWLVRRRLDPILHPELRAPDAVPPRELNTAGLLDECPTEPLRLDAVRAALKAGRPPKDDERAPLESVLVGVRASTTRVTSATTGVKPSIREHKS